MGLLDMGLDPELQKYIAAFGPTTQDKNSATSNALALLGAGLLGHAREGLGGALGAAVPQALLGYQNQLTNDRTNKAAALQQATQAYTLMKQNSLFGQLQGLLGGSGGPAMTPQTQAAGGQPALAAGGFPQPAQAQGQGASGLGGVSPTAAASVLAGFPALGTMIQDQFKPITTRNGVFQKDAQGNMKFIGGTMMPEGNIIQMGPDGKPYRVDVPGVNENAAALAGQKAAAVEGAKAPYTFQQVKTASGATVPMSIQQLMGQQSPQQPPGQNIPPEVLAAAQSGKPFVASQAPGQGVQFQQPGKADPWVTIPKIAQTPGIGQSTYGETVAKGQGEAAAKLSQEYGATANQANQRLALNQQAQDLVDKSDTGPGAARIGDIKNLLVSRFGIPESSFANTPSATITLQKDLLNAATQKAKAQFGSRMTQSEVMLMLSRGAPNIDMTKVAMKFLLQSDSAQANYQIEQANNLGKYLSQGGDPNRFEGWYSQAFPMGNALATVKMPSTDTATGNSTVDALLKKYAK